MQWRAISVVGFYVLLGHHHFCRSGDGGIEGGQNPWLIVMAIASFRTRREICPSLGTITFNDSSIFSGSPVTVAVETIEAAGSATGELDTFTFTPVSRTFFKKAPALPINIPQYASGIKNISFCSVVSAISAIFLATALHAFSTS